MTEPVTIPDDALIVPYDVKLENGIEKADHLLVPFNRYVELWNRANPDKKIDAHPAPLPYALSGASYALRSKATNRSRSRAKCKSTYWPMDTFQFRWVFAMAYWPKPCWMASRPK